MSRYSQWPRKQWERKRLQIYRKKKKQEAKNINPVNKPGKAKDKKLTKLQREANGLKYPLFLKTKYWKEVRKLVLKRDNNMCVKCFASENLHIHHKTYKHHFAEHKHLEILETLCKGCHEKEHNIE